MPGCLAELRGGPFFALAPVWVLPGFERGEVGDGERFGVQVPVGREGYASFGGDVGVRKVADYFVPAVLGECYVDYGGLAAEFDVFDGEFAGADLGSSEEVEVECYCVWLVLFAEGCVEVFPDDREETGCYVAAMWNCSYHPEA